MLLARPIIFLILCALVSNTNQQYFNNKALDADVGVLPDHTVCGKLSVESNIYGGHETNIDEFPWTALLIYENIDTYYMAPGCSGSLINNYHVITAAHCVRLNDSRNLSWVSLGDWNITSTEDYQVDNRGRTQHAPQHKALGIIDTIIHPNYNETSLDHDIAIIRLAERVDYTAYISPICLPLANELPKESFIGYRAAIVGWGFDETNLNSNVKLKANVVVEDIERCRNHTKQKIADSFMCTMTENSDFCHGDSGGPLMIRYKRNDIYKYYLIGIISFTTHKTQCAVKNSPSFYVRVADHIDWIRSAVQG